jgi:predicted MPP superfamily phosphohydrolase
MKEIINIKEIVAQIQNDSTLMLIVGVSTAVFLVIFLVIVISAMRIKVYKDSYRRIKTENSELAEELSSIEKELKVYKITDNKNKKEIAEDAKTIKRLEKDTKEYPALQISAAKVDSVLFQTKEELDVSYVKYASLQLELANLQSRHKKLTDENTKCRSNNSRLLMKLENAKR